MLAQTIHAAGESSPGNLPQATRAVALAANNEQELLALEQKLLLGGISHKAIREPDAPWFGQLMAIGCAPMDRGILKPLLKRFITLKEEAL